MTADDFTTAAWDHWDSEDRTSTTPSMAFAEGANWARDHLHAQQAEAWIERLENRAASEAARADTWRERCRDNQGRVRRAARVIADVRTERNAAFTRIQAVRDVLDQHDGYPTVSTADIRAALDGDA